jgi:hypothetical protein
MNLRALRRILPSISRHTGAHDPSNRDGSDGRAVERPDRQAWRHLPLIERTVENPVLVGGTARFHADLAGHRDAPIALARLAHDRGIDGPAGLVSGLVVDRHAPIETDRHRLPESVRGMGTRRRGDAAPSDLGATAILSPEADPVSLATDAEKSAPSTSGVPLPIVARRAPSVEPADRVAYTVAAGQTVDSPPGTIGQGRAPLAGASLSGRPAPDAGFHSSVQRDASAPPAVAPQLDAEVPPPARRNLGQTRRLRIGPAIEIASTPAQRDPRARVEPPKAGRRGFSPGDDPVVARSPVGVTVPHRDEHVASPNRESAVGPGADAAPTSHSRDFRGTERSSGVVETRRSAAPTNLEPGDDDQAEAADPGRLAEARAGVVVERLIASGPRAQPSAAPVGGLRLTVQPDRRSGGGDIVQRTPVPGEVTHPRMRPSITTALGADVDLSDDWTSRSGRSRVRGDGPDSTLARSTASDGTSWDTFDRARLRGEVQTPASRSADDGGATAAAARMAPANADSPSRGSDQRHVLSRFSTLGFSAQPRSGPRPVAVADAIGSVVQRSRARGSDHATSTAQRPSSGARTLLPLVASPSAAVQRAVEANDELEPDPGSVMRPVDDDTPTVSRATSSDSPGTGASAAGSAPAGSERELDELARKLFPRIEMRLRNELLVGRERTGALVDLGH